MRPRGLNGFGSMKLGVLALLAVGVALGEDITCEPANNKNNMCKLRVGMIGGANSLWGKLHKGSIVAPGTRKIVAGAFSSDPEKSLERAKELGVTGYKTWNDMLEAHRKGDQYLDYVVILTPNKHHFAPVKAFLEAGVGVLCEKPMTMTVAEAEEIDSIVAKQQVPFTLSQSFMGHPMVMQAKDLIRNGRIGDVQRLETWYNQEWGSRWAGYAWRADPKAAGLAGAGFDALLNPFTVATWVTGQPLKRLTARTQTFTKGREMPEAVSVLGELENGALAVMQANIAAVGHRNEHGFRIFGSKGSLEWQLGNPGVLTLRDLDLHPTIFTVGQYPAGLSPSVVTYPHDAAVANMHLTMERAIRRKNKEEVAEPFDHPGSNDGLAAMRFVSAVVESAKNSGAWTDVSTKGAGGGFWR